MTDERYNENPEVEEMFSEEEREMFESEAMDLGYDFGADYDGPYASFVDESEDRRVEMFEDFESLVDGASG